MSGIYIPNRPMPEHCGECFSYHNLFGRDICWCGNGRRIELYPDKRPDWCPIVPIPDHGRLIDADALKDMMIEALNDATHEVEFGKNKQLMRDVTLAFLRDIDECPTIPTPQWISVEERLPEKGQNVLVANKRGRQWDIDKAWRSLGSDSFGRCGKPPLFHVTHWMPLPEPPKEVNNNG